MYPIAFYYDFPAEDLTTQVSNLNSIGRWNNGTFNTIGTPMYNLLANARFIKILTSRLIGIGIPIQKIEPFLLYSLAPA